MWQTSFWLVNWYILSHLKEISQELWPESFGKTIEENKESKRTNDDEEIPEANSVRMCLFNEVLHIVFAYSLQFHFIFVSSFKKTTIPTMQHSTVTILFSVIQHKGAHQLWKVLAIKKLRNAQRDPTNTVN